MFASKELYNISTFLKGETATKFFGYISFGRFGAKEDNANKMLHELVKLGYNARKITKNKHGLYPVIYGSFASYSDAQTEMERIKKSHNPEAWLLIEEL